MSVPNHFISILFDSIRYCLHVPFRCTRYIQIYM